MPAKYRKGDVFESRGFTLSKFVTIIGRESGRYRITDACVTQEKGIFSIKSPSAAGRLSSQANLDKAYIRVAGAYSPGAVTFRRSSHAR